MWLIEIRTEKWEQRTWNFQFISKYEWQKILRIVTNGKFLWSFHSWDIVASFAVNASLGGGRLISCKRSPQFRRLPDDFHSNGWPTFLLISSFTLFANWKFRVFCFVDEASIAEFDNDVWFMARWCFISFQSRHEHKKFIIGNTFVEAASSRNYLMCRHARNLLSVWVFLCVWIVWTMWWKKKGWSRV